MHLLLVSVAACLATQVVAEKSSVAKLSAEIHSSSKDSISPSSYSATFYEVPQSSHFRPPPPYNRRSGQKEDDFNPNSLTAGLSSPVQQFATGFGQPSAAALQTAALAQGFSGFPGALGGFGGAAFQQGQNTLGFSSPLSGLSGYGSSPFQFGLDGQQQLQQQLQQQQLFGGGFSQFQPQFAGAFQQQPFLGGQNQGGLAALGFGRGALGGSQMFLGGGGGGGGAGNFRGGSPFGGRQRVRFNQPIFSQQQFGGGGQGLFSGLRNAQLGQALGLNGNNFRGGLFPQQFNYPQFNSNNRKPSDQDDTERSFSSYSL